MFNDPFMGTNSGCYLPGSAEGSGGVIKVLLEASAFIPDLMDGKSTYFNAVKNTLDYLVSIQLEDGNMPTYDGTGTCDKSYGNDSDARVQWCHGAPGKVSGVCCLMYGWKEIGVVRVQDEGNLLRK